MSVCWRSGTGGFRGKSSWDRLPGNWGYVPFKLLFGNSDVREDATLMLLRGSAEAPMLLAHDLPIRVTS